MKIDYSHLEFIHPTMRDLLAWLEENENGGEYTITSLYRVPGDGSSGIHSTLPLRAVDIRCKDPLIGQGICDRVNSNWTYDPSRPQLVCAMFHDVGRGAHIHLQVHPSTERR